MKRRYKLSLVALIAAASPYWAPAFREACDAGCGPQGLVGFAKGVILVAAVVGAMIWAVSMDGPA
ncbi:MAG TPA: hypothetical protein VG891_09520 [Rhizomicrobium sp.]|nr:hypothetical protein [Rhizomicrobium sp.]